MDSPPLWSEKGNGATTVSPPIHQIVKPPKVPPDDVLTLEINIDMSV